MNITINFHFDHISFNLLLYVAGLWNSTLLLGYQLSMQRICKMGKESMLVDYITTSDADPVDCQTLQWRHNGRDGVSNHQPHDCLLNRLFRHRSKKTSKLCVTGLCEGNSPVTASLRFVRRTVTGDFPAQLASNTENVSIWWRHHEHIPW